MIRLLPNDLIAIESDGWTYHAIILGTAALFGGSLCYVFHERSRRPKPASHFELRRRQGFHAIVDWIIANRESRISRVAKLAGPGVYKSPGGFKRSDAFLFDLPPDEYAWSIYDEQLNAVKSTWRLTARERRLPDNSCFSSDYAIKLARRKWTPELGVPK